MVRFKVLYISAVSNQVSGGSSVIDRNLELIKNIPNIDLSIYRVPMQGKMGALWSLIIRGNLILSRGDEKKILNILENGNFDYVFQEGTTSGHLAKAIVDKKVKLVVFAHNVETILYKERYEKNKWNILEKLKYSLVRKNEKKSVTHCTVLISLTKRDSDLFINMFNRHSDYIIPISFEKRSVNKSLSYLGEKYCLFVGSNFFPNNEGVEWFIENVSPYINIKLKVVGSCCMALRPIKEYQKDKVELLGIVEDLNTMYQNALMVVVPLFKGSGMKTKTIEAMSFGKTIIGTEECFQGIECDYEKIGGLCNTANDFIKKINGYNGGIYNDYSKTLFEKCYSNDAVQNKFNLIFK